VGIREHSFQFCGILHTPTGGVLRRYSAIIKSHVLRWIEREKGRRKFLRTFIKQLRKSFATNRRNTGRRTISEFGGGQEGACGPSHAAKGVIDGNEKRIDPSSSPAAETNRGLLSSRRLVFTITFCRESSSITETLADMCRVKRRQIEQYYPQKQKKKGVETDI